MSCHFLLPGGSMGHGYVLQLLFGEKCRIDNYSATTEARKKICTDLTSLECELKKV
jgi:hypothetical protein